MTKIKCILFDMDGVMLDTESQYSSFWKQACESFGLGIHDFEKQIKGTTLPSIIKRYFGRFDEGDVQKLIADLDKFEESMTFSEIRGSVDFVNHLKNNGIKVGLVTSSTDTKMSSVNKHKNFDKLFDTVVTASRVEYGKPNPACYLLAAKDLDVDPRECIVFEDAFAGIEAATSAGMQVVGLSTTNSKEQLENKCKAVIPNFDGFTIEKLKALF